MNWKGLLNYIVSALAIGAGAFLSVAFVGGLPTSESLMAGLSAAAGSMIAHVRQNPFHL